MIKINLLGNDTAIDNSGVFLLGGYLLSMGACLLVCFILYSSAASDVSQLTEDTTRLQTQLTKLKETTKEVHDLEHKREDLNSKLAVIATLRRSKVGPVRVLDDLNMAVPERAWLTEIKEASGSVKISGVALDNQTVSLFMKDLEASDYFENIELVESKQALAKASDPSKTVDMTRGDNSDSVKINEFALQTKVLYAGKLKALELAAAKDAKDKGTKSSAKGDAKAGDAAGAKKEEVKS
jgi:type IV pilus assembly protein PilN